MNKPKTATLLTFPVASTPTLDTSDIGTKIEHRIMTLAEFSALEPIPIQRDVTPRLKRIARLLKEKGPLPIHWKVQVVEYPDASIQRVNGSTRTVIWNSPTYKGPIPSHLSVTVYKVADYEEAKAIYYALDSQDAVEKTKDKITGYYRDLGLSFNTKKIASGQLVKPLEYASQGRPTQCDVSGDPVARRYVDCYEAVRDYQDELLALDKIGFSGSNKAFNATTITAMIMALKTYGSTNARLITGLTQLKDQAKGPSSPQGGTDGMTKILEECLERKQFPDGLFTDAVNLPRQLDFFLWCIEKYMDKATVKQYRRPSEKGTIGRGARANRYHTWWDGDDE
jgi:hypothetical protein